MHYRTEGCALDIAPLSAFTAAFGKERMAGPVAAFDGDLLEKYLGKAVVTEVHRA